MTKVGAIIAKEMEEEIQKQTKAEILEQWLRIAVESPDIDAFEAKITEHAENF